MPGGIWPPISYIPPADRTDQLLRQVAGWYDASSVIGINATVYNNFLSKVCT